MGWRVDERKLAEERVAMLHENARDGEQCDENGGGEFRENPNFPESEWETRAREWLATSLSKNRLVTMSEVEGWISSNDSILPDSLTQSELLGRFGAIQTSLLRQHHQKQTSENSTVGRPPSYSQHKAVFGEGEATGQMRESASDALDDKEEDIQEDPFPPIDLSPSADSSESTHSDDGGESTHSDDSSESTEASFAHGNGGESSKKRKRDDEYGDLISLVAKGFSVISELCAEIKKMCRAETEIIESRTRFPSELLAMGFNQDEVVDAVIKLGGRPEFFGVWNHLDDGLKKKFILHILKK